MGTITVGGSSPEPVSPPDEGMADTPEILADATIRAVGLSGAFSWLDPCAGSGQLVKAALRAGVSSCAIFAVDLRTQLPALGRLGVESLLGTDFIHWAQNTDRRFDRVIANPPFVRLSRLHKSLLSPVLDARWDGIRIPATANYWVAFLIAGMKLLRRGGAMSYILPAAWEYADYASPLREACATYFRELDVHRVSEPMFDGVEDGSVLLVGRGFGEQPARDATVFRHASLTALSTAFSTKNSHRNVGRMRRYDLPIENDQVRMGQIAEVKIGAVTGDAHFFLLTERQRLALGLPLSAVRPILSKSDQIVKSEIDCGTWLDLLEAGKRVWLLDPTENPLEDPAVRAYLNLDIENGGCHRFAAKIRNRDPWYRIPQPPRFDGFVSGMSQVAPWVMLNRMPGLTISNTLYGVSFPNIKSVDEQAAWCLSMLSSTTTRSRYQLVREYPQGLLKLEPRDFANLVVRQPIKTEDARELYCEAVRLIASRRHADARSMVDDWLG